MPLVRVKQKFQVTIPDSVRKETHLEVGDLLEAIAKGGRRGRPSCLPYAGHYLSPRYT
jgi:bifunctional DNA-binding transcriptional regulator/antitoxin component of YhaV-PrlF toxin-antitoxin module